MMERELTASEKTILDAIQEKYGENPKDELFFIQENDSKLSAMILMWGNQGDGPWVHLTNVASFLTEGLMTIEEIKDGQI